MGQRIQERQMKSNKQDTKHEILKPIEPMLANYASGEMVFEEIISQHSGATFAELKYDGYRFQLHKKGDAVKGFTRSLNDVPLDIYPELAQSIESLPDCVIDCELNGGIGHRGFKAVKGRFRSKMPDMDAYRKKADMKQKLELRVFDVLNIEGRRIMDMPLSQRRHYTERIRFKGINPGKQWKVDSAEGLEALFNEVIGEKNEGLVCKNPASPYIPGYRGAHWIKLKKFETIDLAVLGIYMNDKGISQLLCGTYSPEKKCFETLAKVNAKRGGIDREVGRLLEGKLLSEKPSSIAISPSASPDNLPQFYVEPSASIVMEIKAMNIHYGRNWHSCGLNGEKSYSLRIAWAKQVREDKTPMQASTAKDVECLYKAQEGLI
ncbi:MAG: hypothetical protein QME12_07930 [Nanoarchaeota archaeon]|nr:hypothetical protein [Nanoarchaeota archaeon]